MIRGGRWDLFFSHAVPQLLSSSSPNFLFFMNINPFTPSGVVCCLTVVVPSLFPRRSLVNWFPGLRARKLAKDCLAEFQGPLRAGHQAAFRAGLEGPGAPESFRRARRQKRTEWVHAVREKIGVLGVLLGCRNAQIYYVESPPASNRGIN